MGTSPSTTIGIIGAGNIGQAFARLATRAGRDSIISNSGAPERLQSVTDALGPKVAAGTAAAAAAAPIVVLAVPWPNIPDAVEGVSWDGRIVIDATNAVTATFEGDVPTFTPAELGDKTSSEIVAALVPGARVVKAANILASRLAADPHEGTGSRVLFLSGDDQAAKDEVAALFDAAGFSAIDLGGLAEGGGMQQFLTGPLAAKNLVLFP